MRAARHVHVGVPSRSLLQPLHRSVVLALATFAALVTLLLPAPAMARPVNLASGSVAATGGATSPATSHSGRRTHRGEHARSGGSVAGPSSTGGTDAWSGVHSSALVTGSQGTGHAPAAALPASARPIGAIVTVLSAAAAAGGTAGSRAGTRSSRAPPTL